MSSSFSFNSKNGNNSKIKSGKSTSTFSCRNLSLRLRRSMFHKLGRRLSEVALSISDRNSESLSQQQHRQICQNLLPTQQKKRKNHDKKEGINKKLPNCYSINNNNSTLALENKKFLLASEKLNLKKDNNKSLVPVTSNIQKQSILINKYYSKSFDDNNKQNFVSSEQQCRRTLSSNNLIGEYKNNQISASDKFFNRFDHTFHLLFDENTCDNSDDKVNNNKDNEFASTTILCNKTLIF